MKRMLLFAAALVAVVPFANASAKSASAPADEYFGPFKYSAISIRTKIDALGRSYHERWADDASLVHDAGLVESSFRAWAERYPHDSWLAPTAFHLAQLYEQIQTPDARAHAKAMYAYVAATFARTKEAHLSRLRLQHLPSLHAESAVRPTPSPYGPRSPVPAGASPSGAPSAFPSPAPGASIVPAPSAPAVTPAAKPTAAH